MRTVSGRAFTRYSVCSGHVTAATAHRRNGAEDASGGRAATVAVFDMGGVLVDWDPRYLYRDLIGDEQEMERFLAEICTPEWNKAQDAGRPWAEAVATLTALHPEYAEWIRAYDEQWERMLGGLIEESVAVLTELRERGVPTYGLTNFSAEKWQLTLDRYEVLRGFDGVVVSGEEKVTKPDHEIYRILLERYGLDPATSWYVDDVPTNVLAARELGMPADVFLDGRQLRTDLCRRGLLPS